MLTVKTVENHLNRIYQMLSLPRDAGPANTRVQAALRYLTVSRQVAESADAARPAGDTAQDAATGGDPQPG